ncbi:MAG: M28 family peptidase, partial [Asgard group archaeon]|nr:M28 family peptidase [Asgard group archaeon]
KNGELEQPKRGIRFLLMAEFTGTYCYLATNEKKIPEFIAGINLDMVGADQTAGGGRTLILERTHNAFPSYVNDVLSAMLTEASKEVKNFQGTGGFATFKYANNQPFSGGSDHVVLGHPDVGIGTPMFIQWPDRYYHTGEDSIEKVSAEMLHLVGSLTASYCYFLANAGLPDILWIAREVTVKGKDRMTNLSRELLNNFLMKLESIDEAAAKKKETGKPTKALTKGQLLSEILLKIENQILFRKDRELLALDSVKLLTKSKEEKGILKKLLKEMKEGIDSHAKAEINDAKVAIKQITESMNIEEEPLPKRKKSKDDDFAEKMIPIKLVKGPISGLSLLDVSYDDSKIMKKIDKKYKGMNPTLSSALFWLDGKRTLAEIADLVENDLGKVSIPYLVKYMDHYKKYGLIDYKEK